MDLSYCVVNTDGREDLLRCLEAIRATMPNGVEAEVLVLDNASLDGSVDAVRAWNAGPGGLGEALVLVELERRKGKAENDSTLLRMARSELCLLLNEDTELCPGAVHALTEALEADRGAAIAGAELLWADGSPSGSAWRLPGVATAIAQAFFLHRAFITQSGGSHVRRVGWVQSAAMLVRRSAAADVDYLDPAFFVYSDETDFQKRLGDAGWAILHVPAAKAIHHEQLTTDMNSGLRRSVEWHRNRDLYMRKHHGPLAAAMVRALTAWSFAVRAALAWLLPGQKPGQSWLHARLALRPAGEGIREAAAELNARLDAEALQLDADRKPPGNA